MIRLCLLPLAFVMLLPAGRRRDATKVDPTEELRYE
jgi:hypothetical protein